MSNRIRGIQFIEQKGHPAFVVIPHERWLKMQEMLEDAEDVYAYDRAQEALKADNNRYYPADVARRLWKGEHPVTVVREWRGLSQHQLAKKAKLNPHSISHIETGVRKGGITALRKIAAALDVSLDLLTMQASAK